MDAMQLHLGAVDLPECAPLLEHLKDTPQVSLSFLDESVMLQQLNDGILQGALVTPRNLFESPLLRMLPGMGLLVQEEHPLLQGTVEDSFHVPWLSWVNEQLPDGQSIGAWCAEENVSLPLLVWVGGFRAPYAQLRQVLSEAYQAGQAMPDYGALCAAHWSYTLATGGVHALRTLCAMGVANGALAEGSEINLC